MSHSSLFEGLNSPQHLAVKTVNGRVLILAGAGSGKTRVLTLRMAHLVKDHGISPKAILGLTFTNKAAAEMRHRMSALMDAKAAKQVTLCTFHSFCMQILREEVHHLGYTTQFSLYDEKDVQRLVSLIARDLLECEKELPSLSATTAAITSARNKGLKPEEIQGTGSKWHDQFTQDIYRRLQDSMRAYNAVDFDHLLGLTVELFERHPVVLDKYQERYRYIMIDEYQDTNPIQYRLASLLSAKYGNLCVVGDDDQSIYGWRGAEVKNILGFAQATVIKLEQNYRSTNSILKAANEVIGHNQERYSKVLWSDRGPGDLIEVFHAPNEVDEAQAVVYRLAKLKESQGLRWRDIAILYRSNALSRQIELALMKYTWWNGEKHVSGIPYHVHGGVEFYERREVKDLAAYLKIIVNPLDQEAILRVINQPRRGVGEASLDLLTAFNRSKRLPLWEVLKGVAMTMNEPSSLFSELKGQIQTKCLQGIREFVSIVEEAKARFATGSLKENLDWLVLRMNYQQAIHEEVKSDQMRGFKWENVQEFISAIAEYEENVWRNAEEGINATPSLHQFVSALPLETNWDKSSQKNLQEDNVHLMTIHSAKGLEFPACFLVGVEDHLMPHEKSMMETGIEEERRLMYVAITRAMKHLVISMARRRKRMGTDYPSLPSRFLSEISKEVLKITKWDDIV